MQRTPELLRLLLDAGVEFVIIGGVAAIAYGSATFTQDFDITASFREDNLARLLAALGPYHPRYALAVPKRPVTETPAELSTHRNLYLLTELGRLDILSEVVPVGAYEHVAARATTLELYGRPCRIITWGATRTGSSSVNFWRCAIGNGPRSLEALLKSVEPRAV